MKQKGDYSALIGLRDADLYNAYRGILLNGQEGLRIDDILCRVVASPSKRFWITGRRAFVVYSYYRRFGVIPECSPTKRRQYAEIISRVERERRLHPDEILRSITNRVVAQPAPEFYIEPRTAELAINKFRSQKKSDTLSRFVRNI